MTDLTQQASAQIRSQLAEQTLPKWEALPDLSLYMDQVLSLVHHYLENYPGFDEKGLTAAMVNNYVKQGALPAPVKKRYTREHLARLLVICILKPCLPIAAITEMISRELESSSEQEFYEKFSSCFVDTCQAVGNTYPEPNPMDELFKTALMAQAERALSLKLHEALFPPKQVKVKDTKEERKPEKSTHKKTDS